MIFDLLIRMLDLFNWNFELLCVEVLPTNAKPLIKRLGMRNAFVYCMSVEGIIEV